MRKKRELTDEELHGIQRVILELIRETDRICRKYDIAYSLDGGTLLGAMRNGGFIPWDEDGDVIMLRAEYERFREACRTELDESAYFLQDYTTDSEYRWGYAKLRRNGTRLVRYGQEHIHCRQGIWLDIFVVDAVPDGAAARKLHHAMCFLVRKGLYSEIGRYSEAGLPARMAYTLLSLIPRDGWFAFRNWLIRLAGNRRTELISHYTHPYPKRCRYGLPRRCFDEMIETEFEGERFMVFAESRLYLDELYGDWKRLPPEEQRRPHHDFSELVLP